MISPSGFTSLFHLTRELMDSAEAEVKERYPFEQWAELLAAQRDDKNYDEFPNYIISYREMIQETRIESSSTKLWNFLDDVSDACVFPFGSEPFFVSPFVFKPDEPYRLRGLYVDLLFGTIGSGLAFGDYRKEGKASLVPITHQEHPYFFTSQMVSLLHLPICFPTPVAKQLVSDEEITGLTSGSGLSDEQIVQHIVEKFDNGEPVKKEWVRSVLCGGMKHAVFQALWKAATLRRPALSKPGPRGTDLN